MKRRNLLISLAAAPAVGSVFAQSDYPSRAVTLVVGYPPGGSVDLTARIVSGELSKRLGQAVVVDNVGGAGGTIGALRVANAAPDGHTLLLGSSNEMAIASLINPALRYNPQVDFAPIGLIGSQPLVLVAAPHTGVKTLADFLRVTKANPGKYSYGSSGIGTALHLAGEMIKEAAGTFIVHIPYRGVGPLTNDLIGGQLDFGVFVLSSGLPHIRSGKVVALGTTGLTRSQSAPEIPAISETAALRKVSIESWFALFAPAKIGPNVSAKLRDAFVATMATPEVRAKLVESGARPPAASSESPSTVLASHLKAEGDKYAGVVNFANIRE